ncbi:hypothetical protein [Pleomorphomonas oryzae]|uniref:hypothetical protein n=1 Tax=Pleomorphomonas oryzae TaxID=261934 RepID=UPI0003FF7435|nr:hypothetical protein [Pleomorphomonas oryzae]
MPVIVVLPASRYAPPAAGHLSGYRREPGCQATPLLNEDKMQVRTISIAFLCLFASAAAAQTVDQSSPPSRAEMRRACSADYRRFCSDFSPGSDGLRQCFADNKSKLSSACVDVLKRQATAKG